MALLTLPSTSSYRFQCCHDDKSKAYAIRWTTKVYPNTLQDTFIWFQGSPTVHGSFSLFLPMLLGWKIKFCHFSVVSTNSAIHKLLKASSTIFPLDGSDFLPCNYFPIQWFRQIAKMNPTLIGKHGGSRCVTRTRKFRAVLSISSEPFCGLKLSFRVSPFTAGMFR